MNSVAFADFEALEVPTAETSIFLRRAGRGPALVLLHQINLMWRDTAPLLARRFTVVCADLRGYGRSGCPPSDADHAPYAKRALARDMVEAMRQLGHTTFGVAGHDRGGRVAYRLALDHPAQVTRLAVLDVLTIADAWERATKEFAVGYWPWSLLAQAEPLPEKLPLAAPDAIVDSALQGWGTPAAAFDATAREAYVDALRDSMHVHAICEEYRAAARFDHAHDIADRDVGRRIGCPMLVLWSGRGPLGNWYTDAGGPLALWRAWADDVTVEPFDGGHFFPEEMPEQTADALLRFFSA